MAITEEQYLEALKIVNEYEGINSMPRVGDLIIYSGSIHLNYKANLTPGKPYRIIDTATNHPLKKISCSFRDDKGRVQWYTVKTIKKQFKLSGSEKI